MNHLTNVCNSPGASMWCICSCHKRQQELMTNPKLRQPQERSRVHVTSRTGAFAQSITVELWWLINQYNVYMQCLLWMSAFSVWPNLVGWVEILWKVRQKVLFKDWNHTLVDYNQRDNPPVGISYCSNCILSHFLTHKYFPIIYS